VFVAVALFALAPAWTGAQTAPAPAANGTPLIASGIGEDGSVKLGVNKSAVIVLNRPQKRISIGEPSVVDVNGVTPTRLLLTARKAGTTQVIVWDDQDRSQTIDVLVQTELGGFRQTLDRMFPGNKIEANVTEDTVLLTGHVSSLQQAQQAEAMAAPYGKKVVNLLEISGGQQVMLQVRVAEVSKTAIQSLGVNFGFSDGTSFGASNIGQVSPLGLVSSPIGPGVADIGLANPSSAVTLFGKGMAGNTAFAYFISALRENDLLRVLAEPNLIARSGQEASFLAGGEFPVPVPQAGSDNSTTITIEYKEFGVRLRFTPVVLGDGNIRLKLAPEVSDLDFTTAVRFSGFVVPGLTTRRLSSVVELADGQSLAIAGLLNQNVTSSKQVTPLLGDIPVLGVLFRSVRYQRKETELVVLVTPHLVAPLNPGQLPKLPGEYWRHPTESDLFLMQDIGGPAEPPRAVPTDAATTQESRGTAPLFRGNYGFVAPQQPTASAAPIEK
jgi:pilus assembly protein CpaC